MKRKTPYPFNYIIVNGYACTYLVVIAYPLYLMVVTSLKPNAEIFKNPLGALPNRFIWGTSSP